MDANVLREYLVSLGWKVDQPGFARFGNALRDATKQVQEHTDSTARAFAGVAGAIAGGMLAITGATVGLMKHVADAELGFQLFGLQMFMSADSAKRLKIATDALGYSLDEISWNPELLKNYNQLIADQIKLQKQLGPEYEHQMMLIREVGQQFDRLRVAGQYVAMGVVMDLAKAFGLAEANTQLDKFVNDFIENQPKISKWIADVLEPIIRATGTAAKDTGEALLHMLGTLVGDESIQGPINLEKIKQGIKDIGTQSKETVTSVGTLFKGLDHYSKAASALSQGDTARAGKEFDEGERITREGGWSNAPLAPTETGRYMQQLWQWGKGEVWHPAGFDSTLYVSRLRAMPWFEGWVNEDMANRSRAVTSAGMPGLPAMPGVPGGALPLASQSADIVRMLIRLADEYHLPRELVLGIAMHESHFDPSLKGAAGERGVMQLHPMNFKSMGVTDPEDIEQTARGGVKYLAKQFYNPMLQSMGPEQVLAAYNSGEASRGIPFSNRGYVTAVEEDMARIEAAGGVVGGVQIDQITINVAQTPASAEQIKTAVADAMAITLSTENRRTTARYGGRF